MQSKVEIDTEGWHGTHYYLEKLPSIRNRKQKDWKDIACVLLTLASLSSEERLSTSEESGKNEDWAKNPILVV